MKDFFKIVGASLVALIIFTVIVAAISLMSIVGMVAASSSTTSVEDNSVLVLKLDGQLAEQAPAENPLAELQGESTGMGLAEILSAIHKAKDNDNIKGIYMECDGFMAGFAQRQEIYDALADFKQAGKWIIAYGETYGQGNYYLASLANKIYLNPIGTIEWSGLGGTSIFMKDLLAKAGLTPIVLKCGKYKSATEVFTEDKMSDPSREQTLRYLTGAWDTYCTAVSKNRGISKATLNSYADQQLDFQEGQFFLKAKMVDGLCYNDEIKDIVKKQLGLGEDDELHQVSVDDMQGVKEKRDGEEIAVYYAEGDIVPTESPMGFDGKTTEIAADKICEDLQGMADDDDVKAVVLRVNSPGGDAYASEQIWHAIEKLKAKKPVVVSMGTYAASGGYYISSAANYIVAEPTTLTGSIGIFACLFGSQNLMTNKLGLKFDPVSTNRNPVVRAVALPLLGVPTIIGPYTSEQIASLQASVDRGYTLFKTRVSQGRKLTMAQVEERAQGHVFLGMDALKLRLVDALGGMDRAVAKAAQLAKLKEYYTANYPAVPSFFDQLMDSEDEAKNSYLDEQLRATLGVCYEPFMWLRNVNNMSPIQARMPFMVMTKQ